MTSLLAPWRQLCLLAAAGLAFGAQAQQTLNIYSARPYQTDVALYTNFTKATGIAVKRVDADYAAVLARLQSQGKASPADVVLLVDAARLWGAEVVGLFQPVKSKALEARIPAHLRGKDGGDGAQWWWRRPCEAKAKARWRWTQLQPSRERSQRWTKRAGRQ